MAGHIKIRLIESGLMRYRLPSVEDKKGTICAGIEPQNPRGSSSSPRDEAFRKFRNEREKSRPSVLFDHEPFVKVTTWPGFEFPAGRGRRCGPSLPLSKRVGQSVSRENADRHSRGSCAGRRCVALATARGFRRLRGRRRSRRSIRCGASGQWLRLRVRRSPSPAARGSAARGRRSFGRRVAPRC